MDPTIILVSTSGSISKSRSRNSGCRNWLIWPKRAHLWPQKWTPWCRFDGNKIDRDRIRWLSPRIVFENVIIGEFDDFDGYTDLVYSRESAPPFFDTLRRAFGPSFHLDPVSTCREIVKRYFWSLSRKRLSSTYLSKDDIGLKFFITFSREIILMMSKVLKYSLKILGFWIF